MKTDKRYVYPINTMDALNLKENRTQSVKSIKITESLYNILHDLKSHNDDIKSISEAIEACVVGYALSQYSSN
jgi:hypothetical protein